MPCVTMIAALSAMSAAEWKSSTLWRNRWSAAKAAWQAISCAFLESSSSFSSSCSLLGEGHVCDLNGFVSFIQTLDRVLESIVGVLEFCVKLLHGKHFLALGDFDSLINLCAFGSLLSPRIELSQVFVDWQAGGNGWRRRKFELLSCVGAADSLRKAISHIQAANDVVQSLGHSVEILLNVICATHPIPHIHS
jgi:hypothetical protein